MRFLEYLFFKYYNWQVKVGNGDIPSLMAVLCILFCLLLCFFDVVMLYGILLIPVGTFNVSKYSLVVPCILVFIVLYILLATNGKDLAIIEKHKDEWMGKKNLGAILFPTIAFVVFIGEMFVKMLMNRGVL